tara:strand:- start:1424 stop:1999 length:576 start_codon:yes stop_codon:yes gene_type:complete
MKDRNDYIHEQRVVQLRTYQSIADEMGLSRERVRQIVVAVSQRIRWEQEIEALPDKPHKMCHLVLPRRVRNCLKNEFLFDLTFEEFIEYAEKKKLDNIPNLGKGSISVLETRLAEQGYALPRRLRSKTSLLRDMVQSKREARYAKYRQIMQWREEQRSIKWIAYEVDMSYGGVIGVIHRFLANPGALDGEE